jgi:hypothetical protein
MTIDGDDKFGILMVCFVLLMTVVVGALITFNSFSNNAVRIKAIEKGCTVIERANGFDVNCCEKNEKK